MNLVITWIFNSGEDLIRALNDFSSRISCARKRSGLAFSRIALADSMCSVLSDFFAVWNPPGNHRMFHDIAFRGSAEAAVPRSSPYKTARRRNLKAGMGWVLGGLRADVNQIGIVACRRPMGLPASCP